MDDDGTFELLDAGPNQTTPYTDWNFEVMPTVSVRVTDDDGAQDEASHTATFPPMAFVSADPSFGFPPLEVEFDASSSFDPDGGLIVQYDWDLDDDGTYELIDQGPVVNETFETPGSYEVWVRVTDDEGEVGEGPGFVFVQEPTS